MPMVFSPRIVPQGGGTAVLIPNMDWRPEETDGLKQSRHDPGGVAGDLAGGEANQAIKLALEFKLDNKEPGANEETARELVSAFKAAATANRFTLGIYYMPEQDVIIGFDDCRIMTDGWRMTRNAAVQNAGSSTYHADVWDVTVEVTAQSRLNWTAALLAKITNGETTVAGSSTPAALTLGSLTLLGGNLDIRTADGLTTKFRARSDGRMLSTVGFEVVPDITTST